MNRLAPIVTAVALILPQAGQAQDGNRLMFTLRGGAQTAPGYFGSDGQVVGPDVGFSFGYAQLGRLRFGNPNPEAVDAGLNARVAFRFIGARDAETFDELQGLTDIDPALEIGGGLTYAAPGYFAFVDLRKGLDGHEGLTAGAGIDFLVEAGNGLTLHVGPRLVWGDDDFAATYFGVTPDEAAASGLAAFDAGAGLVSVGAEIGATWQIDDIWGIDAAIRYEELRGDAAASPITVQDEQWSARIGVTRRFDWRF